MYFEFFILLGMWDEVRSNGDDHSIPDGLTNASLESIQRKQNTIREFLEEQD